MDITITLEYFMAHIFLDFLAHFLVIYYSNIFNYLKRKKKSSAILNDQYFLFTRINKDQ